MKTLNFKTKEQMDSKIETMKEVTNEFGTEVKSDLAKLKDITKILEDDFSGESVVKVLKEFDSHENIMVEMVKNASFVDGIIFLREKEEPQVEDVLAELMVSALKVSVFLEKMAGILKSIDLLDKNNPRFVVDLVKAKLDAIQLNIKINQITGYVNGIQWVIGEENDEINELLKNI